MRGKDAFTCHAFFPSPLLIVTVNESRSCAGGQRSPTTLTPFIILSSCYSTPVKKINPEPGVQQ